jgi:hypothetical protein
MARPSIAAGPGVVARPVFEPGARFSAPGELGRAPGPARSAGKQSRHPGCVSFGYLYNTTCTVFDIHGSANRQTDLVRIDEIEGKQGHRFVFQGR